MSDKLTFDFRMLARKLFITTNWALLAIMLVLVISLIEKGHGGGMAWFMYSVLFAFGLPYFAYYIVYRLSRVSSKSGEVMATISAASSLLILAAVAYYIVGLAYFYINGSLRV